MIIIICFIHENFQLKSDFITDEPKDILGALELYRNMASYLGKDDFEIFLDFAYEVENNLTESIKDEQMGIVKKGQSLSESIENYRKSNYITDITMPYIRHLDNQVNLIDMFFTLMNSTRWELKYFSLIQISS